ncbi:guanylate kinase [Candidatus Poribacteria bacterium]|nr:guanylate kinase [Candidatus Poribacteria bacterium]
MSARDSRQGLIIVVSAPSGAGKTTVCETLVAEWPDIRWSVSFTTRLPRRGERDGRHYHFVTLEEFESEREKGRFVEWAKVHGNLYGTPRDFLEKQILAGKDTLLVIDVQGARAVKESFPDAVLVFLLPPSLTELERRLRIRSQGGSENISSRLRNAKVEFSCYRTYDYVVVNDDVAEAASRLKAIILAERCKTSRLKRGTEREVSKPR